MVMWGRYLRSTAFFIHASVFGLLIVFNSCGGEFTPRARVCRAADSPLGNLIRNTMSEKSFERQYPSPFSSEKVLLGEYSISNGSLQGFQKITDNPEELPVGSKLVALVDTSCLMKMKTENPVSEFLSMELTKDRAVFSDLDKQAFSFQTSKPLSVSDLENEARKDECLLGVSYNRTYKVQATFNDPEVVNQGHVSTLRLLSAFNGFYDQTNGMPLVSNGREPIIAIVDTGVDYRHPDLIGRMWRNGNGVGIDASTIGTSVVNYDPMDNSSISHGTHVAGLAAAAGNNGLGVIGIMPFFAKIMAIRVFYFRENSYETTSEVVSNGIRFAYQNGADIINLSLGRLTSGSDNDPFYLDAIREAVNRDSVVVAAIGNSNSASTPGRQVDGVNLTSLPALYGESIQGMITVGSVDSNTNNWSTFSHFSPRYVELAAPGAESPSLGLLSTVTPVAFHQNLLYSRLSGTSMSAPIVSGAAALTIGILRNTFGMKPKAAEVESLLAGSSFKDSKLTGYFKEGRRMDFEGLMSLIHKTYPETVGASGVFSSRGCP